MFHGNHPASQAGDTRGCGPRPLPVRGGGARAFRACRESGPHGHTVSGGPADPGDGPGTRRGVPVAIARAPAGGVHPVARDGEGVAGRGRGRRGAVAVRGRARPRQGDRRARPGRGGAAGGDTRATRLGAPGEGRVPAGVRPRDGGRADDLDYVTVDAGRSLAAVAERVRRFEERSVAVLDDDGSILGVIYAQDCCASSRRRPARHSTSSPASRARRASSACRWC